MWRKQMKSVEMSASEIETDECHLRSPARQKLEGDIVLVKEIGRGGQATVYRGSIGGKPMALKVCTSMRQAAVELDLLSRMLHPNITQVSVRRYDASRLLCHRDGGL